MGQVIHAARVFFFPLALNDLEYFYFPLDTCRMLVHDRVTALIYWYPFISYSLVERGTLGVKCLSDPRTKTYDPI